MPEAVIVDMCVSIRNDCPIMYLVTADKQVEFTFGGLQSGCHYAFDAGALRSFIGVAAEALAELDGPAAVKQSAGTTCNGAQVPSGEHAG
jgi:hypothetical protein